jgi:hypothetical protein
MTFQQSFLYEYDFTQSVKYNFENITEYTDVLWDEVYQVNGIQIITQNRWYKVNNILTNQNGSHLDLRDRHNHYYV